MPLKSHGSNVIILMLHIHINILKIKKLNENRTSVMEISFDVIQAQGQFVPHRCIPSSTLGLLSLGCEYLGTQVAGWVYKYSGRTQHYFSLKSLTHQTLKPNSSQSFCLLVLDGVQTWSVHVIFTLLSVSPLERFRLTFCTGKGCPKEQAGRKIPTVNTDNNIMPNRASVLSLLYPKVKIILPGDREAIHDWMDGDDQCGWRNPSTVLMYSPGREPSSLAEYNDQCCRLQPAALINQEKLNRLVVHKSIYHTTSSCTASQPIYRSKFSRSPLNQLNYDPCVAGFRP